MERGEGSSEKRLLEAGFVPSEAKKQWKNPSQVQILENAYAVAPNPSVAIKEELAKLTGLDYKQVQYWFGNRRYMDRHGPRRYRSRNEGDGRYVKLAAVPSPSLSACSALIAEPMNGTESTTLRRNSEMLQPLVPAGPAAIQAEIATQMPLELQRVVEHIEKKLGHPLRADGPILSVDFKPVPPGAFGAPLANAAQQRAPLRPCDGKAIERTNFELIKAATSLPISERCLLANLSNEGTRLVAQDVDGLDPDDSPRAVQEYQFFPMQPSWLESYERVKQTHHLFSSVYTPNYETHPSGSTSGNDKQQLDYTEVQKMVDSKKERDWGVPEVGHGDHGQGCHRQGGQDACRLQRGWIENQSSSVVAFREVVNKNCNKAIMNQTRSLPHQVGHRNRYNRYCVRPRERSQSSIIVAENTRVSYFSDIGGCARPLIAEWNERENRAVYIVDDNENDLSWSIGSDSTCSDGFDDEATENGKHYAPKKSVDLFGIDAKEDDVGVVHEGQEVMDVDRNVEDDEDETDCEDYKGLEEVTRDKNIEVDEDKRESPLSSEQTA